MKYESWAKINWSILENNLAGYQQRVYRAEINGQVRKRKKLQRKICNSFEAKLLAVRQVTERNKGKKTPGVDEMTAVSNKEKLKLAKMLNLSDSSSKPIRRIYIPKPGKVEKRPLGIPVIKDRALQCLVKYAIEPQWEAVFEPNSYGFRPGRSCQDAIEAIRLALRSGERYILDADIQKCFDTIDHDKLLGKLNTAPTIVTQIEKWLKAKIMEGYLQRPKGPAITPKLGTPQGGVISPLLANIALHGLETAVRTEYAENIYSGAKKVGYRDRYTACTVVRYADDFVIISRTEDEIRKLKSFVRKWLSSEAGLKLSPEKTNITASTKGIVFLGFQIIYLLTDKGNRPKLKIHPSRMAKKRFIANTRQVFQSNRAASATLLIHILNPKIVGWCNYYRYSECTRDFKAVEYVLFGQLRAWVFRRKSKGIRSRTDLKNKYFPTDTTVTFNGTKHSGNWILVVGHSPFQNQPGRGNTTRQVFLVYPSWVRSKRYVKVRGDGSPYDANHTYWSNRLGSYGGWSVTKTSLFKNQEGICPFCAKRFSEKQELEIDHKQPLADGGKDNMQNKQLLHRYCHTVKSSQEATVRSQKNTKRFADVVKTSGSGYAAGT